MDEKITAPLNDESLENVSGGITWANTNNNSTRADSESGAARYTYTVKKGDTLSKIAAAKGVTIDNLVKWNQDSHPGLKKNRNLIYEGWELVYYK